MRSLTIIRRTFKDQRRGTFTRPILLYTPPKLLSVASLRRGKLERSLHKSIIWELGIRLFAKIGRLFPFSTELYRPISHVDCLELHTERQGIIGNGCIGIWQSWCLRCQYTRHCHFTRAPATVAINDARLFWSATGVSAASIQGASAVQQHRFPQSPDCYYDNRFRLGHGRLNLTSFMDGTAIARSLKYGGSSVCSSAHST